MRLSRRASLDSGHASPRHRPSAHGRARDCRARLEEPPLVGSPHLTPAFVCVCVCVCARETLEFVFLVHLPLGLGVLFWNQFA